MPRKNPDVDETDDKDLEVGKPKEWAAGIPGVLHSMQPAIKHMGLSRTEKTLLALNQKHGFDCMSCAWPDPDHRKTFEFCENGGQGRRVGSHARGHRIGLLGGASRRRAAPEDSVAEGSNTPASQAVLVRLEPCAEPA